MITEWSLHAVQITIADTVVWQLDKADTLLYKKKSRLVMDFWGILWNYRGLYGLLEDFYQLLWTFCFVFFRVV
jgi:hypothetical protein